MYRHFVTALLGLLCVSATLADELTFEFVNPTFGGNPLNGNYLLNRAQLQEVPDDDDISGTLDERSALDQFNDLLQRVVLNKVASEVVSKITTDDGLKPGTIQTSDFIIEVHDVGDDGKLSLTTTDKLTGDSTTFNLDFSNILPPTSQ